MLAITIDLDSEVPVYRQIADEIRGLVAREQLASGAELPSVRKLGQLVGVNQNPVAKAYRMLADEGLIDLRHGAKARVRLSATGYRDSDDDAERRLDDVVSRLVLQGLSRREIEQLFGTVLDRFFPTRNRK